MEDDQKPSPKLEDIALLATDLVSRILNRDRVVLHGEIDREEDGRWIVDVTDLPGVMVYGATEQEAICKAYALALRVLADRAEHGQLTGHRGVSVDFHTQPA